MVWWHLLNAVSPTLLLDVLCALAALCGRSLTRAKRSGAMQSPGFSGDYYIYYLLSQTLFSLTDPSLAEAQKVCIFAQSNSLLLMELDSVEVIATWLWHSMNLFPPLASGA